MKSGESEAAGLSARKTNTARTEKWKRKKRRITVSKTVGIAGVAGGVLAVEVVIDRSFLQGEGFLYS